MTWLDKIEELAKPKRAPRAMEGFAIVVIIVLFGISGYVITTGTDPSPKQAAEMRVRSACGVETLEHFRVAMIGANENKIVSNSYAWARGCIVRTTR